jgi:hypothetical protein
LVRKWAEMLTWPIADRRIEWNTDDTYIEGCLRACETLDMLEMSEGIYSGKSPLSKYQLRHHLRGVSKIEHTSKLHFLSSSSIES